MDTPTRAVSWLERFPPDIWAYLVYYIPGEQLGRLLMTGATFLWQKLRYPNVVKSIKLGQDYIVFKRSPRFLNEFPSLIELSIRRGKDAWINVSELMLDSIPSGIRKLELSGFWSDGVPSLFEESTQALKLYNRLPHLDTLNLYDFDIADNSWMTHSPQSLTSLSLFDWDGHVALPASLIRFEANTVSVSVSSFVLKLPPSLESFEAKAEFHGVDLVAPLLAPSCRKLDLGGYTEYSIVTHSPKNLLGQLPKSLTWLKAPSSLNFDFEANPELTSLLPATLTDLTLLEPLPCSAWPLLPQQLTTLSFRAGEAMCTVIPTIIEGAGFQVQSIPFDCLPRSITRLEILSSDEEQYFCGPPTTSNHTCFPPHLTRLQIPTIQLSPATAKLLPSSLTHLEIRTLCERICEHLPNTLKTLKSFQTLMSPNLIKFLPNSLSFLRLSATLADDLWFGCDTGEIIDDLSELPAYSLHEKCLSNRYDWTDSSPLPLTLTFFELSNAEDLGDSFLQYHRLPNMLELSLEHSTQITDLSVPLLSPHLTTLNLESSSEVSGKSFEFLPRSLTYVNLNSSESIFDSDIQHLPRTLKYAHLCYAIHLTDLCIPDLPPHLEKLELSKNSQITRSSLPHFPYPIRSSQICNSVWLSGSSISFGEMRP